MKGLKLGQYMIGHSPIHELDSRTKVVCCLMVIMSVLISGDLLIITAAVFLVISGLLMSGVRIKKVLRAVRSLWMLLMLTFIFQAALTPGTVIAEIGVIHITEEGLLFGLTTVLRLLVLYLCSCLLTTTTPPARLTSGLEYLSSPLQYLRVPVHKLAVLTSISLRFIPLTIQEAEIITEAQKSRGARLSSPRPMERLRSMPAVLIPLLAASLQRAGDLAIAMESRGYTGDFNRSGMEKLEMTWNDGLAMLAAGTLFIGSLIGHG